MMASDIESLGRPDRKREVLALIEGAAEAHPEWLADMAVAMQSGVQARLAATLEGTADVEAGFADLLGMTRGKALLTIGAGRRGLLFKAVRALRTMRGTPFQEKWLEKLKARGNG